MYCDKSALLSCLQNTILSWLSSGCNTAKISFKARQILEQLPSKLIFAPKYVKKNAFIVSSLRCCVYQKSLTYITNYVLTSKHEYKFDVFALGLVRPRRLAISKFYTGFCSKHPLINIFPTKILFCSKRSHNWLWKNQWQCKLCVKTGPASLKSLCVNKLGSLPSKYRK
jgi:hypothetical protein